MGQLRERIRHAFDLGTSLVEPLDPPPDGPHLPRIDLDASGYWDPPERPVPMVRCTVCGYDLRVMADPHCPECGGVETAELDAARGLPLRWLIVVGLINLILLGLGLGWQLLEALSYVMSL